MTNRRSNPFLKFGLSVAGLVVVLGLGAVGGYYGSLRLEENDAFCGVCHSEPETTYVSRGQAASATDLASDHSHKEKARCIDCHSGPGDAGRQQALFGTAIPDTFAWLAHTGKQPAVLTKPIPDANCLKCHTEVTATQDFNQHFHAFLPKWQAIDKQAAACVSCHTTHTTDGEAQLGFLQRERTLTICQKCHQIAGVEGGEGGEGGESNP